MPEAAHRRRSSGRHHWLIVAVVVALCLPQPPRPPWWRRGRAPPPPQQRRRRHQAVSPWSPVNRLPTPPPSRRTPAVSVQFTVPLAPTSPLPTLSPTVPGSWVQTAPDVLAFDATAPLPPGATMSVTVPGGDGGIEGSDGQRLADTLTTHFTVAPMTTLPPPAVARHPGLPPVDLRPGRSGQRLPRRGRHRPGGLVRGPGGGRRCRGPSWRCGHRGSPT